MKFIFPESWLYQNFGDEKVKLTWIFKKKAQVMKKECRQAYDLIKINENDSDQLSCNIEIAWAKFNLLKLTNEKVKDAFTTLETVREHTVDDNGIVEVEIEESGEGYSEIVDKIVTIDNFLADQEDDTRPLVNRILGDDIEIKDLRIVLENQEKEAEMISLLTVLGVTREQYENEHIDF